MRLMDWNIEHMNSWWRGGDADPPEMLDSFAGTNFSPPITDVPALAQRAGDVVAAVDPDIICIQEGPGIPEMLDFLQRFVGGPEWTVLRGDGGAQALVVAARLDRDVTAITEGTSTSGDIDLAVPFTADIDADLELDQVQFARRPQVVDFTAHGNAFTLLNNHLKSKFVSNAEAMFNAGGQERLAFFADALKARRRISGEAYQIRSFLDASLIANPDANLIVCGDLNDGPGSDFFEANFLTHSVVDRIFGSVFHADRQLKHVLTHGGSVDFTAEFFDFISQQSMQLILDHIGLSAAIDAAFDWLGRVAVDEYTAQIVDDPALHERDHKPSDHRPVVVDLTPK